MTSRSPDKNDSVFKWLVTLMAAGHFALVVITGRVRWEHVAADLLLVVLAWAGAGPRRFLRGAFPLWLTGMILDSQGLWLGLRGTIHTGDLWNLEKALFPAPGGMIWPEWWWNNPNTPLDLLCGFAYAAYLYEVFIAALLFFFFKKDRLFQSLCWAFFVVNAIGVVIYVLYPAAPPWYVLKYGPGPANLAALPSPAGTARFDAFFGISYFANFYARNPNVFGAMPSLHAAYPLMMVLVLWYKGVAWRVGTILFALLVAFSAVYLTHHYILDVLAGGVAAVVAFVFVRAVFARRDRGTPEAASVSLPSGGNTRA
ncbi:phosphatase PAP2 family protein [Corallococcus sp. bb12-1]|uniref:phosphatase PAP2 family protein n=1 Tax=Corallococcus sp. bb12-1 TaxID=2996784 RepID=UPI00226E6090|nr:phosphatase PAP2 family protein [Corallococcus sp. bb12-1]MCY1046622.1 phosphatase PAP2 family protein [Corallococcus sp. bb12-1]